MSTNENDEALAGVVEEIMDAAFGYTDPCVDGPDAHIAAEAAARLILAARRERDAAQLHFQADCASCAANLLAVERLTAERDAAVQERDEARGNYQWMVERAADEKLDGYRELGARAAKAESERDAAIRERDALRVDVSGRSAIQAMTQRRFEQVERERDAAIRERDELKHILAGLEK